MSTTQAPFCAIYAPKSCRNLSDALHYESLQQVRYLHTAELMEQAELHIIAHAFRFTAAQEKEHAAIFSGLLRLLDAEPLSRISPSPLRSEHPEALLQAAIDAETDAARTLYPAFAQAAQEEGFPRAAAALLRIADTEALHARRFSQFLDALRSGSLFHSPVPVAWLCLPCGQIHFGPDAPARCDACGHGQGGFIRSDFSPFTVTP